jgi:hypothetical protein
MLRTDLWASAFLRRHNDLGHLCVLRRRGDPIAGQVFIEVDHLDGTRSLYVPAPAMLSREGGVDRLFTRRFARASPEAVAARIAREADFDPDFWLIALDLRGDAVGLELARE